MRRPAPPEDTDLLEVRTRRAAEPQRVAASPHGMVATAHHRATAAGVEILEGGGNAVDAAVAAAFALGVCEPQASGLGGQTMMLIYDADTRRTVALDGSSRAPNRATVDAADRKQRRRGYRATTVPSTPATLRHALERFGTRKLRDVLAPAIRLADEGYQISELQRGLARRELRDLKAGNAGAVFLHNGERPHAVGTVLKQPALAETLRRLARKGVRDFYTGQIAAQIDADMVRNDGLIRRDDLAQVPRPIERRPLGGRFGDWRLMTMPPPGAGRTLIEMLNIISSIPARHLDLGTPRGALLLAETIRRAFIDRRDRPFDPNLYPQVLERQMTDPAYARKVAREIRARVTAFETSEGRGETTHLSVMDRGGGAVTLTQSIERVFGACVATPELGFLYNDYLSAFEHEDIAHPYFLRPNAVPWASVAPTLVFRGRAPWLAIGSPGSERITPSIAQVLLRLRAGQSPLDAVSGPRLHCSLKGKVSVEAARVRDDILEAFTRAGYELDVREPYSFYLGCVQLVVRERGHYVGVADPRRDGSAGGPHR